ncbi:MAG: pilus assembly protein PilP [Mariprofundaceae bacterium]|nr:pilus assembly protein PilP [Mariprofundaceae bacterium]
MIRTLIVIFSMMLGTSVDPGQVNGQERAAKTPKAPVKTAEKTSHEIPDAMKHLVKGPDVDIESLRDPFASYLALVASRGRQTLAERQSHLASRDREILETFDLTTLKLVATMRMGENRVAMVEDGTGKGYIVRRGNYMGKNNGRVEKITDNTLYLVEQIVNPAGDIVDRQVTMTLKEVNQ